MDTEFLDLIRRVPTGNKSTNAINADSELTQEEVEILSSIGAKLKSKQYNEVYRIMKQLLSNRKNKTIPLMYRQAIFSIVYFIFNDSKNSDSGINEKGIQKDVLEKLDLEPNLFGQDKWDMKPIEAYKEGFYQKKSIPLKRYGKKNDELIYMFQTIVGHPNVKYKNFVDVFGGLGTITAGKYKRKGENEYLNEYDSNLANLLGVIKFKHNELIQECGDLVKEIETLENREILVNGQRLYEERIERVEIKHSKNAEIENFDKVDECETKLKKLINSKNRQEVSYAMGLHEYFRNDSSIKEEEEKLKNGLTEDKIVQEDNINVILATIYYFMHSMTFNSNSSSIAGAGERNLNKFKNNIIHTNNILIDFSKRLKNVEITCKDFEEVIKEHNTKDTLLYIDSPYYRTTQYDVGFSDDEHIRLNKCLRTFNGKWIFSCRQKLPKSVKNPPKEKIRIETLNEYFKMYKDIAKYVVSYEKPTTDKYQEIMITNFDCSIPKKGVHKLHNRIEKGKEVKAIDIEECGFMKETFEQFLDRINCRQ